MELKNILEFIKLFNLMNNVVVSAAEGSSSIVGYKIYGCLQSITSLINTYDDGKSSGELRKIFNILDRHQKGVRTIPQ